MSAEGVAERFADARAGMALVDFCEVALPCWRVLARCEVLASKPISTIDETIMRAVMLGIDQAAELELMLGLDEVVLESAIVGLIADGRLKSGGGERLVLTEVGQEVLAQAVEIVSREQVVPFDYDGLLRRPVLVDRLLAPRRIREQGMREIPPCPGRPPDVAELRGCRQEIVRLLHGLGDRRHQESQLLAIRGFDRRDRMYRPAVALLFVPLGSRGRCEVAFSIEDELSVEHEAAFANAGLQERLGIARRLRSVRRRTLSLPGPSGLLARLDIEAERTARERVRQALAAAEVAPATGAERVELREARRSLSSLSPRSVHPHEHAGLLAIAVATSWERLLIVCGRASQSHVDATFLRRLRETLAKGANVRIVTAGAVDGQARGLEKLRRLANDFPALLIAEQDDSSQETVLVSDNRFAIVGTYSWLSHLGDATRELSDRRSLLTADKDEIDELWRRFDSRKPGPARPPAVTRPGRRGTRRRRRPSS